MGLTLIRKGSEEPLRRPAKVALVLAGGAVSGGAFKVGGLKALNDFLVGRKVTQFDTYVGLSAGSVLAVPLAAGIGPDEMVKVLDGTSERFDQLRPIDFYSPNFREFAERPSKFVYDLMTYLPSVGLDLARSASTMGHLGEPLREFVSQPSYTRFESFALQLIEHVSPKRPVPALTNHIPSGFFDSLGLEKWLRRNLERIGMPNDFRAFERKRKRELYICACDLDTAERAIFGADENSEVTISQAVQASAALPGFYKPARLNGVDYVDGGVRNTANIDVAIEKGADLIICYNPFRPFLNKIDDEAEEEAQEYFANGRYLSDRGLIAVLNQVFRTLLHTRLRIAMQRYLADQRFKGDIVLLEPREHDANYFAVNPLAFWKRNEAVAHGFESVHDSIGQNFDELSEIFGRYGIEMSREAADRKAQRVRAERGWADEEPTRITVPDPDREGPTLRLVGS